MQAHRKEAKMQNSNKNNNNAIELNINSENEAGLLSWLLGVAYHTSLKLRDLQDRIDDLESQKDKTSEFMDMTIQDISNLIK